MNCDFFNLQCKNTEIWGKFLMYETEINKWEWKALHVKNKTVFSVIKIIVLKFSSFCRYCARYVLPASF